MNTLWCNGQWMEVSDYPASPLDRGAILGLGLFETMLGMDGKVVFCERHLERLTAGCARFGWVAPQQEFGDLPTAMERLLQMDGHDRGRARIRLTVSGGTGALADLVAGSDRRVWMVAMPVGESPAHLAVNISPWPRNERGALAGLKCTAYAENLVALDHARLSGFDESLFFNTSGELCEAATANVFIVRDGVVRTPSLASGCLAGITRGVVLDLARRHRIACEEVALRQADVDAAEEVFLTSATRGPVAVSDLCGRKLPPPHLGSRLRALWEAEVRHQIQQKDQQKILA